VFEGGNGGGGGPKNGKIQEKGERWDILDGRVREVERGRRRKA
jgi:hypothetical protein